MMRMPQRPMPTAAQRRGPTRSPSSGTLSAVISKGEAKETAVASGSEMWRTASMKQLSATKKQRNLATCMRQRRVLNGARRPGPRNSRSVVPATTTTERKNRICEK